MSIQRVRHPSLEFNWLPNSMRKGLSTPRLVIVDRSDCSGFYCKQMPKRCIDPWVGMDVSEAPVVAITENATGTAGVLAHEYRHHWQWSTYPAPVISSVWTEGGNYKASIIRYFSAFWWEMDALKFQLKHAPDDVSRLWWDWLMEAQRCH